MLSKSHDEMASEPFAKFGTSANREIKLVMAALFGCALSQGCQAFQDDEEEQEKKADEIVEDLADQMPSHQEIIGNLENII